MKLRCPDDGACHHGCVWRCWRVDYCGPLSGVYPGDVWPEHDAKGIEPVRKDSNADDAIVEDGDAAQPGRA